ncbi:hypothetical protein KX928_12690 [Roseobacter sp. YSTF-M11]|uniref:Uncharacterized protein n=1 Tax=Roseobacter insulae TaxID=2859783 RepID=A0A9X1K3I2_9RHOB|nr:hypothetical protein [Roseobacter insulae]MBW4708642.1 hypothetical protein [Roseobacter insulae]
MDMGLNAYTVASHLTMIAILTVLAFRVLAAPHGALMQSAIDLGFKATVAIGAVALIIERTYYVIARFLKSQGINLWEMHPAPEALSLVVAFGLYSVMIPLILAAARTRKFGLCRIALEISVACTFWAMIAWVLY